MCNRISYTIIWYNFLLHCLCVLKYCSDREVIVIFSLEFSESLSHPICCQLHNNPWINKALQLFVPSRNTIPKVYVGIVLKHLSKRFITVFGSGMKPSKLKFSVLNLSFLGRLKILVHRSNMQVCLEETWTSYHSSSEIPPRFFHHMSLNIGGSLLLHMFRHCSQFSKKSGRYIINIIASVR